MAESSESIQTSKLTSRADIVADEAQFVDAIGLAIDLYQVSVQLLEQQWHGIKTSPDLWTTEQRTKMAYCLSQVRLWGSGFSQGDLRQCLEGSTYLASSLIEVLSALAKVIVAEDSPWFLSVNAFKEGQPVTQLRSLISSAHAFLAENCSNDGSITEFANSAAETPPTQDSYIDSVSTYVAMLSDLTPSLESSLGDFGEDDDIVSESQYSLITQSSTPWLNQPEGDEDLTSISDASSVEELEITDTGGQVLESEQHSLVLPDSGTDDLDSANISAEPQTHVTEFEGGGTPSVEMAPDENDSKLNREEQSQEIITDKEHTSHTKKEPLESNQKKQKASQSVEDDKKSSRWLFFQKKKSEETKQKPPGSYDKIVVLPSADNVVVLPSADTKKSRDGTNKSRVVFSDSVNAVRQPRADEVSVMASFARHASHCSICTDLAAAFRRNIPACERGASYARDVCQYIYSKGGKPYSVIDRTSGERVQIAIPPEFRAVNQLVKAIALGMTFSSKADRDTSRIVVDSLTTESTYRGSSYRTERRRYTSGATDLVEIVPQRRDRKERGDRESRRTIVYTEQRGSLYARDEEEDRRRRRLYEQEPIVILTEPRRRVSRR